MFGQIVIGPPGSGKTTYCHGVQQLLNGIGRRVAIINIDPGNESLPYECSLDISELITVEDVMKELRLGPNGAQLYCMEYLEKNIDWLIERLKKQDCHYVLIDCPGQVELCTHHNSLRNIVQALLKCDWKLAAVHLVDSHYCTDPGKFVAAVLTSLTTMLQIELPFVNVLSKVDLFEKEGRLHFNVDFYTDVLDLSYLLELFSENPVVDKYKKLNEALVGLIEDYSLVSYYPLNIQEKESTFNVIKAVDKANGYVFGTGEERNIQALLSTAIGADFEYFKTATVREKYVNQS